MKSIENNYANHSLASINDGSHPRHLSEISQLQPVPDGEAEAKRSAIATQAKSAEHRIVTRLWIIMQILWKRGTNGYTYTDFSQLQKSKSYSSVIGLYECPVQAGFPGFVIWVSHIS